MRVVLLLWVTQSEHLRSPSPFISRSQCDTHPSEKVYGIAHREVKILKKNYKNLRKMERI